MRDAITIGRLSAETGVNIETIRYYERIGLMDAPARSPGGRRLYGRRRMCPVCASSGAGASSAFRWTQSVH